eukprot:907331-Pleurochrysis_carterae.AAC.1
MYPSVGVSPSGVDDAANATGRMLLRTRWGITATVLPSARSVWERASPLPSSSPCLARMPPSPAHPCSASASSHSARL